MWKIDRTVNCLVNHEGNSCTCKIGLTEQQKDEKIKNLEELLIRLFHGDSHEYCSRQEHGYNCAECDVKHKVRMEVLQFMRSKNA